MKLLLIVSATLSIWYQLLLEICYWIKWIIDLISHSSLCIPVKKLLPLQRNYF